MQKILLLTKNYPPQIGGIEKYAFDLYTRLVKDEVKVKERINNNGLNVSNTLNLGNVVSSVKLIAAGPRNERLQTHVGKVKSRLGKVKSEKGKGGILHQTFLHFTFYFVLGAYFVTELWRLGWFAVRCFTEGLVWLLKNSNNAGNATPTIIWSLDGSIAWIGYVLVKVVQSCTFSASMNELGAGVTRVTLHGRDVAWNNPMYQKVMPWFWRHTDDIIAVSDTIRREAIKRSIQAQKITIQEHSLSTITFADPGVFDREELLRLYNIPTEKILLFSIGRFVEKKGFHWFLSEVLPFLDPSKFHYVLTGNGALEGQYRTIIKEKGLTNVTLTGPVSDPVEKARLYTSMNYFIMPNILVEGDCEGYGIVLLEAQHYGLKCVVSDVDGIGGRMRQRNYTLMTGEPKVWSMHISKLNPGN